MADTVLMKTGIPAYAAERWYYYKETLSSAGAGDAVLIPSGDISALEYDLNGDATLEATIYTKEEIEADTAVWRTVSAGQSLSPAVSAVRQTNVSGVSVLFLRAQ